MPSNCRPAKEAAERLQLLAGPATALYRVDGRDKLGHDGGERFRRLI
jgi:hypothetical protein